MGAQAAGRFSVNGGFFGGQQGFENQYRTWGVTSFIDPYRQENIHDLSVRIYQHHPQDQTLFDPRTFAVHHFNPGVHIASFNKQTRRSGTSRVQGTRPGAIPNTTERTNFLYSFERPLNEVDFQVPSRYQFFIDEKPSFQGHVDGRVEPYHTQMIPPGDLVYSDYTLRTAGPGQGRYPPVAKKRLWQFSGIRIGKLLPFRYEKQVIGIPCDIGEELMSDPVWLEQPRIVDSFELIPSNQPGTRLVVRNRGGGYQVGDLVGNPSLSIGFEVTEVDDKGKIKSLMCFSSGDFDAAQASKYGSEFKEDSDGPIPISDNIKTFSGKDFYGYFVVARVNTLVKVDSKPKLITSINPIRVASDIPQAKHATQGTNASVESLAIVEDTKSTEFLITDDNKSSDNRYDIFFHFHNDITMTWLASNQDFHGDRNNAAEAVEQFISARITVS
jgi:hypothetical protein